MSDKASLISGAPVTLSRNFTLKEFLRTDTGLPNEPTSDRQLASMIRLCATVLQPTRDMFGPLIITSGFRSPDVNAAVGGSPNSQHMDGEAADFTTRYAPLRDVFIWMTRAKWLPIGQVVYEQKGGAKWIHVSLPRPGKEREALVYDGSRYLPWPA